MPSIKSIRSVERAIQVLRFLQTGAPATLEDIHRGTDLPRATVARLLLTLQNEGMVRRGLADSLYRNTAHLPRLTESLGPAERLAEAGAPVLERLQNEMSWPSDLGVRNGNFIEVVETSRALTPLAVTRNKLGDHIGIALSAVGRAYVAGCNDEERDEIIGELEQNDPSFQSTVGGRDGFITLLDEVRKQGFALRDPMFRGQTSSTDMVFDDGLNAIAIAMIDSPDVLGCINLVWNRRAAPVEEIVEKHLATLQQGAADIIASMNSL